MSDESKMSKLFPDELAEKILRIFPEYGPDAPYLWKLNGVGIGVENVGGSEEFARRCGL
jgi:hypothetical protein